MNACYACGICASGCPASGLSGMDPRKFLRMLVMEQEDRIMDTDWVWMCTTCNRCLHVCPMKIDIPRLVLFVRSLWPENRRPKGIASYCRQAREQESCAAVDLSDERFLSTINGVAARVRNAGGRFDRLAVPVDKQDAEFFLNQSSEMLMNEPMEMAALWKILHQAGADWTYGAKGWAAENYCMFLADDPSWEALVRRKSRAIDRLGCKVLLNTECGHDFFAVKKGLEIFKIPHRFEVRNIIEYYAEWIREGRLLVNADWNIDLKIKFTVQDPCQLVRKTYGDYIARELRFVVKEAVGEENVVEMTPNCSNNYCCGGGGGAIRTDFTAERLAYGKIKLDQILETGAAYCITPCNNCHSQIRDLARHHDAPVRTVHLWTVLGLSLGILDRDECKYLGDDLASVAG